jgi:acyl-homoserine lactone acylase PvdQ
MMKAYRKFFAVTVLCALFILSAQAQQSAQTLAQQVTIHRDTFGVPHIFGKTDAAVVFGLAYAQCEDNFWQLETDYINALGRAAELEGERALARDLTYRLFETERLSKAEYDRLPANLRALCDAFAAGVNYFIAQHSETKPRLLSGLEGWQVLAFARSGRVGGVNRLGLNANEIQLGKLEASDKAEGSRTNEPMNFDGLQSWFVQSHLEVEEGSNMWAVSSAQKRRRQRDAVHQSSCGIFRRRPTLRSSVEQRGRLECLRLCDSGHGLHSHGLQSISGLEPHQQLRRHGGRLFGKLRRSGESVELQIR